MDSVLLLSGALCAVGSLRLVITCVECGRRVGLSSQRPSSLHSMASLSTSARCLLIASILPRGLALIRVNASIATLATSRSHSCTRSYSEQNPRTPSRNSSLCTVKSPFRSHELMSSPMLTPYRASICCSRMRSVSTSHTTFSSELTPGGGCSLIWRTCTLRRSRQWRRPRMNSKSSSNPIWPSLDLSIILKTSEATFAEPL